MLYYLGRATSGCRQEAGIPNETGKVETLMHAFARSLVSSPSARRLRGVLVAALCMGTVCGVVTSASNASSLEEIKKRGYMVVATEDNYPPFEFVQDGQPAGLDHDLYKLLKEWAGFQV